MEDLMETKPDRITSTNWRRGDGGGRGVTVSMEGAVDKEHGQPQDSEPSANKSDRFARIGATIKFTVQP